MKPLKNPLFGFHNFFRLLFAGTKDQGDKTQRKKYFLNEIQAMQNYIINLLSLKILTN